MSMSALSVAIEAMVSPRATGSPSWTRHSLMVPSVMS